MIGEVTERALAMGVLVVLIVWGALIRLNLARRPKGMDESERDSW